MEEKQLDIGKIGIGTKQIEKTKLEAKPVTIAGFKVEMIDKIKKEKVIFLVKHPDKEDAISLSAVSYLEEKKVSTKGTWLTLDDDGKLQKGSSLATFLARIEVNTLEDSVSKTVETELDNNGFLVFKAY